MATTKESSERATTSMATHTGAGVMLGIHLDVGHSSIGWAVTESTKPVMFRGCGTVLFPKDGCLASERRANRRQRRHIRSTRQRIARMRVLLTHMGVLSEAELNSPGGAWPWKIAAEVLTQERVLSWPELWDLVRWYAHNRGYDDNALWKRDSESSDDDKETRESVENARHLMGTHGKKTMAETICAVMKITPCGKKCASLVRYKASKASFPRDVVVKEVRQILEAHRGKLPGVDDALIRALTGSPKDDPDAWQAVGCSGIVLPKRYVGGLLFGQLVPRFDNRIIGICPIGGDKKPLKSCPEFLEYRWAMQVANVRVRRPGETELSPLSASEREAVTGQLRDQGYFTPTAFKKAVKEASSAGESNLDDMLLHPDAEKALVFYPAKQVSKSAVLKDLWDIFPKGVQRRILKQLGKGKKLKLREIREWLADTEVFDKRLQEAMGKGKKKDGDPLERSFSAMFPSGRAPYGRKVMRKVVAEVMAGKDPRMEGGVLYAVSRAASLAEDAIDKETNNHLVRNRLRILRRLVEDIVEEYANGDKALIERITIELNREAKDLSGKTAKQIASELGLRLKSHKDAVEYAANALSIPSYRLGGSLIRKVRVAMDLDWTCPYTLKTYCIHELRDGSVDLDHIIPRSKRNSDSLDSLVVTFKAVNEWKTNTTAMDFVQAHGGKQVPSMPNLSIASPRGYEEFVEQLRKRKMSHPDDQRRRDNRCKRMLTRVVGENGDNGFTPRDLTVSSHLVTLASAVMRDLFTDQATPPMIHSIPGRITKEVRMGCEVIGALAKVNPQVLNADNELKTKTEIRDVSHLHHAVDAVTLGLATSLIPVNGEIWGLMIKRNLYPAERDRLQKTGAFRFDASGRPNLLPLDEETRASIEKCLCECRVATHMPKNRHGAALEKTTWRIAAQEGEMVEIHQRSRDEKTGKITRKTDTVNAKRLLGVTPRGKSKLQDVKGAIVISDNYGIALDPVPEVLPYHQVWKRIGEIKKKNKGVMPRIIRNGMIIRVAEGRYQGVWKIFSVKNSQTGVKVDMGSPDVVKLQDKTPGHKREVTLSTLLKDGLEICASSYTGVPRDVAPPD